MRLTYKIALVTAAVFALAAGTAAADTTHPELGAKLSGMGEHGVVNIQANQTKNRLCWTFQLTTKGITAASIRDAHGMIVAKLGSKYSAKGCAVVAKKAFDLIEAKPRSYRVWVDTKAHPGDLRGTLFAGMAHM